MSYYELRAEQKGYFHFYHREQYETPAHFHGSIELLFVESGELPVSIDGETRVLTSGEGYFCDSFSVHRIAASQNTSSYALLGKREYFERAFAFFDQNTPPRFFRFDNFSLLRLLCDLCSQNYQNDRGRYATFEGTIDLVLGEIAKETPLQPKKTDKKNSLVCEILQYAEENPQADLSLLSVAKRFGYSHEYLSRILHKYLMEHWNSYVNRLRVRRADALLKTQTDRSVLDVAYECGFDSPNTFYRAYKKEFGKAPKRK